MIERLLVGERILDRWFPHQAGQEERRSVTRVFVAVDEAAWSVSTRSACTASRAALSPRRSRVPCEVIQTSRALIGGSLEPSVCGARVWVSSRRHGLRRILAPAATCCICHRRGREGRACPVVLRKARILTVPSRPSRMFMPWPRRRSPHEERESDDQSRSARARPWPSRPRSRTTSAARPRAVRRRGAPVVELLIGPRSSSRRGPGAAAPRSARSRCSGVHVAAARPSPPHQHRLRLLARAAAHHGLPRAQRRAHDAHREAWCSTPTVTDRHFLAPPWRTPAAVARA